MARLWSFVLCALAACTQVCHGRRLTAAVKHPKLLPRDIQFTPSFHGQELMFGESAAVTLKPKHPILILDDYEDYFTDLRFYGSEIDVVFRWLPHFQLAQMAWDNSTFVVITSRRAGAMYGEFQPYLVTATRSRAKTSTITLSVKAISLKHCTHSMRVEFGEHMFENIDPAMARRAVNLVPRSISTSALTFMVPAATQTSTTVVVNTVPATYVPTAIASSVSYVFSTPSAFPTATSSENDVSFSEQNQKLFTYKGVTVTCTDCTMTGNVDLTAGGFDVNSSDDEQVEQFFDDGFLEFTADNVKAHMAFDFNFVAGVTESYTAKLPTINLLPFHIAGVIELGPQLELNFPFTFKLGYPVDVSAGFTLEVPDGSKAYLNISEAGSSYTSGFAQSVLSPLPLNAKTTGPFALNVSAGFTPALILGAGIGDGSDITLSGGAGVFFDLPIFNAEIIPLTNATAMCEAPYPGSSQQTFDELINVIPSYTIGGGLKYEFSVEGHSFVTQTPLATVVVPLPTECYTFGSNGGLVNSTKSNAAPLGMGGLRSVTSVGMMGLALTVWLFSEVVFA